MSLNRSVEIGVNKLKDVYEINSTIDLLFQISWRATEIDWGEKYSKSKTISEREWRALEGLSRALPLEELPQREQMLNIIKQELIKLMPKLTAFLNDTSSVDAANEIPNLCTLVESERMAWFFEKWLTCMAPELRLRQLELSKTQESSIVCPTENHLVVSELDQIARHTEVVRNFAISLGFTDEILVRGRLIKDPIGIQGDLDLIVKFRDSSVPRTNIFELENVLSQYFGIQVQICTEETLAQRTMVIQPQHLQQTVRNAKDLLSIRLSSDKRQHLLDKCWHHLTMQGVDKPIREIECRGTNWTDEQIERITTILLYPDDKFLKEQAAVRQQQLEECKPIIAQKACKFAGLILKAVQLCKDSQQRRVLLVLLKRCVELYREIDCYYFRHREEIFAIDPELTPHALRSSVLCFDRANSKSQDICKAVKDQVLIDQCSKLIREAASMFATTIRPIIEVDLVQRIARTCYSPEDPQRLELERIFGIWLLLFDEIRSPVIIECLLAEDIDREKLISFINKDFIDRFLDPFEEANQSIWFKGVEFPYLKPCFFQEVIQAKSHSSADLIFDDIEINCRSKVQSLKLGYKPATAEMICTTENMGQFLLRRYAGKVQMVQRQMREYLYPGLSSLNELLKQHGIKPKVYPDFEEDSRKFALYLEFNKLLEALANLEKERIFCCLEIAKQEFYMRIYQDSRDFKLRALSQHSVFGCLQRISALQQMQHAIIIKLVNTGFVNYKRKLCTVQNFDMQLITELLNWIFSDSSFVTSDLPPEIDITSILKKERSEREQEFLRILFPQVQKEAALAFTSGYHPRLGKDSPVFSMPKNLMVEMIYKYGVFGAQQSVSPPSSRVLLPG